MEAFILWYPQCQISFMHTGGDWVGRKRDEIFICTSVQQNRYALLTTAHPLSVALAPVLLKTHEQREINLRHVNAKLRNLHLQFSINQSQCFCRMIRVRNKTHVKAVTPPLVSTEMAITTRNQGQASSSQWVLNSASLLSTCRSKP